MPNKDEKNKQEPSVYKAECKNNHPPAWIVTNKYILLTKCDICNEPCNIHKAVSLNLLGK